VTRIERDMSVWDATTAALSRSGQVARCIRTFRNWHELTQIYAGSEMPAGFIAEGRDGFRLPLRHATDAQTVWVVFCANDYFVPEHCETVLDLGANIGAFTLFASRCRKARFVYAYEPVASTFSVLESNVATNKLRNVRLIRQGIGRETGRRTIYLGVTSQHASLMFRGDPRYESGETEEVEIVALEQVFDELKLQHVDMAKMDCEGGEVEAILQASDHTLRRIKHLSLEYHYPGGISNDEIFFDRLARAGFRCTHQSRIGRLAQFVRE